MANPVGLCIAVSAAPTGVRTRSWTLNESDGAEYKNVVDLSESPLYLELSWRPSAAEPRTRVGLFRLDLAGLLRGGYIRHEPVGAAGSALRVRIIHSADGRFYLQTRADERTAELAGNR